jgi:hypothetical protein
MMEKHGKMIEYCKWHQKFHPSIVIAGIQIIKSFESRYTTYYYSAFSRYSNIE